MGRVASGGGVWGADFGGDGGLEGKRGEWGEVARGAREREEREGRQAGTLGGGLLWGEEGGWNEGVDLEGMGCAVENKLPDVLLAEIDRLEVETRSISEQVMGLEEKLEGLKGQRVDLIRAIDGVRARLLQ